MSRAKGWIAALVATSAVVGCGQAQPEEQLGSVELGIGGGGGSLNSGSGGIGPSFCGVTAGAWPTVVTVNAAAETQLEQAMPTTNHGALETCTMKGGSNKRHCLLRFDLTSIPTSTPVLGGCLKVFVADPSAANYPAAQMLRGWSELSATWERAKLAVPWEVPGAWGILDSGSTTVATLPKNRVSWTSMPVMTSLVQDWVTSPANNYGIIFGNDSSYDGASIGTKEASGVAAQLAVWTGP